jgi:hypothetical protein
VKPSTAQCLRVSCFTHQGNLSVRAFGAMRSAAVLSAEADCDADESDCDADFEGNHAQLS